MKLKRRLIAGTLVGCLLLLATGRVAQATIIPPGGFAVSSFIGLDAKQVPVALGGTGTDVLASMLHVAWGPSTTGTLGFYDTWVASYEAVNGALGGLVFVTRVENGAASSSSLSTVTNSAYNGFVADIGFNNTIVPAATGHTNLFVQRGMGGSEAVGWYFDGSPLLVGTTSSFLVAATNASVFAIGSIGIIDGSTATVRGYAPLSGTPSSTPLPAAAAMGAVLLGGFGGTRKRRWTFGRKQALEA